jgi:hypothetical protein
MERQPRGYTYTLRNACRMGEGDSRTGLPIIALSFELVANYMGLG